MTTRLADEDLLRLASRRAHKAWEAVAEGDVEFDRAQFRDDDSLEVFSELCEDAHEVTKQMAKIINDRGSALSGSNHSDLAPIRHDLSEVAVFIGSSDCAPKIGEDIEDHVRGLVDGLSEGDYSAISEEANAILNIYEERQALTPQGRVHCYAANGNREVQERLELDIAATDGDPINLALGEARACVLYDE